MTTIKYFSTISSLDDLKAQYRALALANHPDMGGDAETMKAINNEYDALFPAWKLRAKVTSTETAESTRSEFYTQNGWKGENYKTGRSTKDIAQLIREYVKQEHNDYRFSVTCDYGSMTSSITVAMTEAPTEVLTNKEAERGYIQLNQYQLDRDERITDTARAVMQDINRFICSYRYDDSDSMIDYFCTNFYYNLHIGRWDKPVKIVPRTKTAAEPVEYETVKVKFTKTVKEIQAFDVPMPSEFAEGQYFKIVSSGFNYGVCRGYVYQIRKVSGIIFGQRMNGKLNKTCEGYANSANTFNVDPAKLKKWVETGAITFVELREVTVKKEVEKEVRRPVKREKAAVSTQVFADTNNTSSAAYSADTTATEPTATTETIPADYTITPDTDTRDGSQLWVVKFVERMSSERFNSVRIALKTIGGYYSKFKGGFIFRTDPTHKLDNIACTTCEGNSKAESKTIKNERADRPERTQEETEQARQQQADIKAREEQERRKAQEIAEQIEDASTDIIIDLRLRPGEYAFSTKYRERLKEYITKQNIVITEQVILLLEYKALQDIVRSIFETEQQSQAG